jgi:hypothetical protein
MIKNKKRELTPLGGACSRDAFGVHNSLATSLGGIKGQIFLFNYC